ncbi:MAG: hypothetical protein Q8P41_32020 [Pseudomonadota bacterium]|nr:hypothetical protein [Pseudomonadota bacterium]
MTRLALPFLLALALTGCDAAKDTADDTGDTASTDTDAVVQDDADEDTILDIHEGTDDADGDGKANFEDKDADGDTIRDIIEAGDEDPATLPVDSDGDGVYDYLDDDSDGNCIGDATESGYVGTDREGGAIDSDGDDIRDFQDPDNDGDGILDTDEVDACATTDTDGDGTADYLDDDSDGDGIGDGYESGATDFSSDPVDTDGDGIADFRDTDSDNDGLSDRDESGTDGNPALEPRDTDSDGRYDYADVDADGDSLPDADEVALGSDPYDSDTDGDGFSDGGEVTAGTDPLDSTSVIDGIYVEVPERTTVEENFDFELNIEMGDIAFIIDTTGSMGGTISAMASEFAQVVTDLQTVLPDAAYGVGGHDDYAFGSFGSPGTDKPFYLRQQVTTDSAAVQTALSALSTHSGADGPESGTEALYQAASGAGYDQDCDGTYDTSTDVYPFMADAADPFGGSGGSEYDSATIGGGTVGGFGFREYALPVVVLASDNYLRDPESANTYYNRTPGGCPIDAGMSDAVSAFLNIGAYFVGVSVNGTTGYPQMITFSQATSSFADLDGDGVAAEEVVETWSGSNAAFRTTVVEAITQLVASVRFSRVDLSVDGDAYGFVTAIDPAYYEGLGAEDSGAILNFTLTFRGTVAATTEDQLYRLTLNILGDSSVLLDSLDIIVRVPGTAF